MIQSSNGGLSSPLHSTTKRLSVDQIIQAIQRIECKVPDVQAIYERWTTGYIEECCGNTDESSNSQDRPLTGSNSIDTSDITSDTGTLDTNQDITPKPKKKKVRWREGYVQVGEVEYLLNKYFGKQWVRKFIVSKPSRGYRGYHAFC